MSKLEKLEVWVHDHLKNENFRHFVYGVYQRVLYLASPKIKAEGVVTRITPDDPFEYLFGYYDKSPWSDDGKYLLALKVKSATEAADSSRIAEIVTICLDDRMQKTVAQTHSWNVQQGCMAQWLSNQEILFNDFRNNKNCAVILNLENGRERVLDMPVYAVSPDRTQALTLDFARLHRLRPGYGYSNAQDKTESEKCPDTPCIWKIDLKTGHAQPLLKYTDFATFEPRDTMADAEHKVNHLMISPDGQRFMVLHRWFQKGRKFTRLVTCSMDGTGLYNLSDDDFVSHCCWKNSKEILAYLNKRDGGKGYYLLKDKTPVYTKLWSQLVMDGHPSYSYDGEYAVTDTYPDRRRLQSLYIMKGNAVVRIARFFSPFKYSEDTRCDLHPRWSRDGKLICVDASFDGRRAVYVVNTEKGVQQLSRQAPKDLESSPVIASVIIPCYNCAHLIDETLGSLEAQSIQAFEVICVNDGSTDDTLQKLKSWKKKGSLRLRVIDLPHGGVGKARNRGIDAAQGQYLLFLDSDDIYHPQFIELLTQAAAQHDIAYSRLSRKLEDVYQCDTSKVSAKSETTTQMMDHFLNQMGSYGFYCCIYKKEKLESIGLRFDENTWYGEDREFCWKYMCHSADAAWIDLPLYGYRINPFSVTQQSVTWRKTDLLQAVRRIEEYLQGNPYAEQVKSYMFARAVWAVSKAFAVHKEKELYARLRKEYDVKACMKRTARDHVALVRIASILYLIHPQLFYRVIYGYSRLRNKK